MSQYVLGVDGGGTKTHCALFDEYGNKVDIIEWTATNHEHLKGGYQELERVLGELIIHILSKNKLQISDLKSSVFGLAGVDTKLQHKRISEIIKSIGINEFILCNDAFLGVKAGCKSGTGICAINGTGCTVTAIDHKGQMFQVGGFGEISGDHGGGDYLANKAISAVYNSLFKNDTQTLMTGIFFEMLNIDSKHRFMEIITEAINEKKYKFKDFNKIVFLAANQGDKVALDILETMGLENAKSINAIINMMSLKETIEIVFAGSIYVKGENPTAINVIQRKIQNDRKESNIHFIILDKPPVSGAIIWALDRIGAGNQIYHKVINSF